MTQSLPHKSVHPWLAACLHFLFDKALSAPQRLALAQAIENPLQAFGPEAPVGSGIAPSIWQRWLEPSEPVATAIASARQWLTNDPAQHHPRSVLTFWDAAYPLGLRQLPRPPWMLLIEGQLPSATQPALAIVGSRHATQAGLRRARDFAFAMAERGWLIVSGMALGIDAAAHTGAIHAQSPTLAVLGCGIAHTYPKEHTNLRQRILQTGGAIVSEYPPDTPPHPRFFPARNRLIAGWSAGTLVVEAAIRSGSLITAQFANDLGRAVMAIPGSIDAPQAKGCHQMIRAGARLVETLSDIEEELVIWQASASAHSAREERLFNHPSEARHQVVKGSTPGGGPTMTGTGMGRVPPDAAAVLKLFEGQPRQFDDLSTSTTLAVSDLAAHLLTLELAGLLEQRPGQWWIPA